MALVSPHPVGGVSGTFAVILLVIGAVVLVLGVVAIQKLGSSAAVRLRIGDDGLSFVRKNGKVLSVRWDDPGLKLNLSRLEGDPNKVLIKGDARGLRPFWVDVWTTKRHWIALETTLPQESLGAIRERARARGVRIKESRVAFYWHSAPKSPGWLDYDLEGSVGKGRSLNGEITKLRGPQQSFDP